MLKEIIDEIFVCKLYSHVSKFCKFAEELTGHDSKILKRKTLKYFQSKS